MKKHLIILGAPKCGTTWLQHILDNHHEVYCPPEKQEIHFFDRKYNLGINYYINYYKPGEDHLITCDNSPNYIFKPGVIEKIYESKDLINRKLIFCILLRDPVERIISNHKMQIRKGKTKKNLLDAIKEDKTYITYSNYSEQIEKFYKYFDKNLLTIILFEDFVTKTNENLKLLKEFLGLTKDLKDPYKGSKVNEGGMIRFKIYEKILSDSGIILRKLHLTQILHKIKSSKIITYTKMINRSKIQFNIHEQEFIDDLRKEYKEEVYKLSKLINRPDLPKLWKYE